MAVWHEVWIPAAAAGSLYVILLVGMLLMKFRCAVVRSCPLTVKKIIFFTLDA